MKRAIVAIVVVLGTAAGHSQTTNEKMDSLVNTVGAKFISDRLAPALSIGIYHDGKAFFYNFGSIDVDHPSKPTSQTIYEIGFITKTFVGLVLASAVADGRIGLDDDIRKYLKGDYPNLEYQRNPIRIKHLANTTSILPDWLPALPPAITGLSPDSALAIKIAYYRRFTRQQFFDALHRVSIDTIPGTRRMHSNAAAQLLAYILEDVYKMPMEKLIRKYVTEPFDMKNTSFLGSGNKRGLATGYNSNNSRSFYEFAMPYFQNAGGLTSTTADLTRYMERMLDTSNKMIALTLEKTVSISTSTGNVMPETPRNTIDAGVYNVGLNWFSYQPSPLSFQIWVNGATNGFNSYLALYPQQHAGVVLLANRSETTTFRELPAIAYSIWQLLKEN